MSDRIRTLEKKLHDGGCESYAQALKDAELGGCTGGEIVGRVSDVLSRLVNDGGVPREIADLAATELRALHRGFGYVKSSHQGRSDTRSSGVAEQLKEKHPSLSSKDRVKVLRRANRNKRSR